MDNSSWENISIESGTVKPAAGEILWTVHDVAHYWQVSPATVRKMAREGKLSHAVRKLGRLWRFDPEIIKNGLSTSKEP